MGRSQPIKGRREGGFLVDRIAGRREAGRREAGRRGRGLPQG